jgi:NAD(P)-dependent dehydrogenase (short-subunit alcohol dehydrogenase family)
MMNLANRLQGQVALITGGGGEIGTAIALRLAAEGSAVVIGDLDQAKAEVTAKKVIAAGGQATGAQIDVSDPASCEAIVAFAMTSFGKLTTLVNVAAVTPAVIKRANDVVRIIEGTGGIAAASGRDALFRTLVTEAVKAQTQSPFQLRSSWSLQFPLARLR